MARPKNLRDPINIQGWIEREDKEWIEANYPGSVSDFLRKAISEQIASEDPKRRKIMERQIEDHELEAERLRKRLEGYKREDQDRKHRKNEEIIKILKTILEEGNNYTIPGEGNNNKIWAFAIVDQIQALDLDKVIAGVNRRLGQISEVTGEDKQKLIELASEHVQGFDKVKGKL